MIKDFYRYIIGISFVAYQSDVASMYNDRNSNGIRELARQRPFRGVHIQARELTVRGRPNTARSVISNSIANPV